MADPVQNVYTTITKVAKGATGTALPNNYTGLGADRVCQLEPPFEELARSTRLFCGTLAGVANAIVPVVDVPTTAAPVALYNNAPTGGRSLVMLHFGITLGSGTTTASGATLIGGVTAAAVASPPTANATGWTIQATRGVGTSQALIKTATTIPSGTTWVIFDGIIIPVTAVTGPGKGFHLAGMFVIPPTFAFAFGVLGDTGTAAKYLLSLTWAEVELDLDT